MLIFIKNILKNYYLIIYIKKSNISKKRKKVITIFNRY